MALAVRASRCALAVVLLAAARLACDGASTPAAAEVLQQDAAQALHDAARRGDLAAARRLLEQGAEVNSLNSINQTALHIAVLYNQEDIGILLLDHRAAVDVQDINGRTPLHGATMTGNIAFAELLLAHRANVNAQDFKGRTPLHSVAALASDTRLASFLLDRGAHIDAVDSEKETPLMYATTMNNVVSGAVLIQRGAALDLKNAKGWTALHLIANFCHEQHQGLELPFAELLLGAGASTNATDTTGATPLHVAATRDALCSKLNMTRCLLEHGAPVNARDLQLRTPLHAAVRSRGLNVFYVLLEVNGVDIHAETLDRWTPFHDAAQVDSLKMLMALADHGANVQARTKDGDTALHIAATTIAVDAASWLIETHASVEVRNNRGFTPLHSAIAAGALQVVCELIDRGGADPNEQTGAGTTPVSMTLSRSGPPVDSEKRNLLMALLSRGGNQYKEDDPATMAKLARLFPAIDITERIQSGWISMHWAAFFCDANAFVTLVSLGKVALNARTTAGQTAHDIVRSLPNPCKEFLYFHNYVSDLSLTAAQLLQKDESLQQAEAKRLNRLRTTDFIAGVCAAVVVAASIMMQTLTIRLQTLTRYGCGLCGIMPVALYAVIGIFTFVTTSGFQSMMGAVAILTWALSVCMAGFVALALASRGCQGVLLRAKKRLMNMQDMAWHFVDIGLNSLVCNLVLVVELFAEEWADLAALVAALLLSAIGTSEFWGEGLSSRRIQMLKWSVGVGILAYATASAIIGQHSSAVGTNAEAVTDSTLTVVQRTRPRPSAATMFMGCAALVSTLVPFRRSITGLLQATTWIELAAVQESKFVVGSFRMGRAEQAAGGLTRALGLSPQEVSAGVALGVEAMRREVTTHGDRNDIENFEYIVDKTSGKPEDFPSAVRESLATGIYHGGSISAEDFDTGHENRTLSDWMSLPQVQDAALTEAEFVAVRFYTSSSFAKINRPLREGAQPHPWAMVVYFLDCGVKKLRAVQAKRDPERFAGTTTLWRGMKNLKLDVKEFKRIGGTELAPMSTTTSEDVAKHYASSQVPLIFKYSVSGLRTGVSIQFCSLYPKEEEYLYPPLTYMSFCRQYEDDGMHVIVIEPVMS